MLPLVKVLAVVAAGETVGPRPKKLILMSRIQYEQFGNKSIIARKVSKNAFLTERDISGTNFRKDKHELAKFLDFVRIFAFFSFFNTRQFASDLKEYDFANAGRIRDLLS